MGENAVVPEVLDHTNYKIWSNCMQMYLLGQDLWDIIESEPEQEESPKVWRKKNALAIHAIYMSCGKEVMSKVSQLKSAKEAWELLRSINIDPDPDSDPDSDSDTNVVDGDRAVAEEQSDDSFDIKELPDMPDERSTEIEDNVNVDYDPLIEAIDNYDWKAAKEFIDTHPEASAMDLGDGKTLLHFILGRRGDIEIGRLLVDQAKRIQDFEIKDNEGCTSFAYLVSENKPGVLELAQHMVSKNPNLPNIGDMYTVPAIMASSNGYMEMTRYLYSVTDKDVLNPDTDSIGAKLVINCINFKLIDIALEIVTKFPKTLQKPNNEAIYPIYALAKFFSALGSRMDIQDKSRSFELKHWLSKSLKHNMERVKRRLGLGFDEEREEVSDDIKSAYDTARDRLRLACAQVSSFDETTLSECVDEAMIEASKNGNVEFVSEMLIANPKLIYAFSDRKTLFWSAIENRQEKVYNLIYSFIGQKDKLLSYVNPQTKDTILHLVAKLAPPDLLDWRSGPASQMQREAQWFQELYSMVKPSYREQLNYNGVTPAELFNQTHEKLMDAGEKVMKDAAQSSTVVGALIITVMFTAAFTVPGGYNQDGFPVFSRKSLFKTFMVCDALSLYSSIAPVLAFLGILTPRYAGNEFLLKAPKKLMIGLYTLFFSLLTMMLAFCAALGLMLDGVFSYILPILLLVLVPIILVLSPILPLVFDTFKSTLGPSIFGKNTKFEDEMKKKIAKDLLVRESANTSNNSSRVVTNSSNENGEKKIINTSSIDDTHQEESFNNSLPITAEPITADERV